MFWRRRAGRDTVVKISSFSILFGCCLTCFLQLLLYKVEKERPSSSLGFLDLTGCSSTYLVECNNNKQLQVFFFFNFNLRLWKIVRIISWHCTYILHTCPFEMFKLPVKLTAMRKIGNVITYHSLSPHLSTIFSNLSSKFISSARDFTIWIIHFTWYKTQDYWLIFFIRFLFDLIDQWRS